MKTTLDELQAFTQVVDGGSITAAAEQLGQTASGISRALGRLEEKLEVTLLRRTTRRQVPAGRLRVNAASPFMLHVLVPLVAGFRERYPQIELELNSNDQIIDLLEQRTDLAIRIGPLRDSSLHARPLGCSRIRVLASPAYLRSRGTPRSVAELEGHDLLGFTQPESLNVWPLRHALGEGLSICPSLRASSGETLRQLALGGAGLVCLSDFMTAEDRQSGALVEVMAEQRVDSHQPINAVYYRNTALAARITCFLDYLGEHLAGRAWARN
jgi:DNA-binding transcriptional LysR family regulator